MDQKPTPRANTILLKARTEYVNDKDGNPVGRDWVEYCAPGQASFAVTSALAHHAKRNPVLWAAIGPAYDAWKSGQEAPAHGTPLGAWPGVNETQAEAIRAIGLRTVEDVAAMTDTIMARIRLPNARSIRDLAQRFITAKDDRAVEQALADKDREIADLRAKMDQLADMVAASNVALPAAEGDAEIDEEIEGDVIPLAAPRRRGRPPKAQSEPSHDFGE